jgi:hypothetical protein
LEVRVDSLVGADMAGSELKVPGFEVAELEVRVESFSEVEILTVGVVEVEEILVGVMVAELEVKSIEVDILSEKVTRLEVESLEEAEVMRVVAEMVSMITAVVLVGVELEGVKATSGVEIESEVMVVDSDVEIVSGTGMTLPEMIGILCKI